MDIKDVKLYDTVRIKPDKCLSDYERRLIYAVTQIDVERKLVSLSSLNHKDYFESSIPDTPRIDVSDIENLLIHLMSLYMIILSVINKNKINLI